MGPEGLEGTIRRGGPMIDSYPADWSNHYEGHIMQHWTSNKAVACSITDPEEVPRLV